MTDVVIIGGGIIGLSSAYYLTKAGHTVTVIDKGGLEDNCSYGNAGMIVPSHFVPLAAPGMISKGIRWMFSSKSPFYVKPALSASLIGWGLSFIKYANAEHVASSAIPLRDLSLLSKQLYEDLSREPDFEFGLKNNGILAFFKNEKVGEEEAEMAKHGSELGLDMAVLDAAQCQALQPDLKLNVLGAIHYRCDSHLYPNKLMHCLINYLEQKGVHLVRNQPVDRIEMQGSRISRVFSGDRSYEAKQFVLAGGSWSPQIARQMRINIKLMPGKGYSFMEDEPGNRVNIPALLCEARVAITPMNGQLRYGGTMELSGLNDRVNMNRVKGIVEAVPDYFPELKPALPVKEKIWYGFRPTSPDGLPYIGKHPKLGNLLIATGHGMMGLSLGPATGLVISNLIGGKNPDVDLKPFSPVRF